MSVSVNVANSGVIVHRGVSMKAAVFREVNVPMEIEDIQVSKPGPREVLIRTGAAGICHSDMHFLMAHIRGKFPWYSVMKVLE